MNNTGKPGSRCQTGLKSDPKIWDHPLMIDLKCHEATISNY